MNEEAFRTCIDQQVLDLRKTEQAEELILAWEKTLGYLKEKVEEVLPKLEK
jgi:hypothetical protein